MSAKNSLSDINDISSLLENDPTPDGKPLEMDISLIDDYEFNRKDVSEAFKNELTNDIEIRGVKEPLRVTPNPEVEGRFICISGHTRKECALRAGKKTVPVVIDHDFDEYDVIKANLLREDQSPESIRDFISHRLEKGDKESVIAKKLGKSAAYVSQHVALIDLPAPINEVFESKRCSDVTLISELLKLHKKHPTDVEAWLSDESQDITRNSFKLLGEFIKHKSESHSGSDDDVLDEGESGEGEAPTQTAKKEKKEQDPTVMKKFTIRVEYQGRDAMLLPNIRPTEQGCGYIKFDEDGDEIEAPLDKIKITSILES